MRILRWSPAALLVAMLTVACASGGSSGAISTPPRGSLNLITEAEIESAGADLVTAFDVVQRLRPTMMRPRNLTAGARGGGSEFGVIVFIGETRAGEVDQLRQVMRGTVKEIRYISATDATTRWGTGLTHGVIQVVLK